MSQESSREQNVLPARSSQPDCCPATSFSCDTKAAFDNMKCDARSGVGAMAPPPVLASVWELVAYLADAGNDLEAPAGRFAPVIEDVLSALGHEPACVLAQMSGSGATCFGLFDGPIYSAGAAERIAQEHPHWWVKSTRIAAPGIGAPEWSM